MKSQKLLKILNKNLYQLNNIMKFKLVEDIELYYNDLEFEVSDGNYDRSIGSYGDKTVSQDFKYDADENDVIEFLLTILKEIDPVTHYRLSKCSNEAFNHYFDKNLDQLVEKYYEQLLDYFEDKAKAKAADNYYD